MKEENMKYVLLIWVLLSLSNGDTIPAIRESARDIPVAYTVDIVVGGGNLAGVAAAITAANLGAEVLIIHSRPSFSHEVSDKSRYWLEPNEVPQTGLEQDLLGTRASGAGYYFITPGPYKKRIEEALVQTGVRFLFWTTAVGVLEDGSGNISGVVIVNKAGRQVVKAKVVIDATSMAGIAQMAGAEMTAWPGGNQTVSCTKMIPGSDAEGTPIVNYSASTSDYLREYSMQFPFTDGSWTERCAAEYQIRRTFPRQDAAWMSHMIHLNEPNHIIAEATDSSPTWPGAANLSLDCCRPRGLSRIYVASGASAVSRANAAKLIRPLELIALGKRIGAQAKTDADGLSHPSSVIVKTNTSTVGYQPGLDVSEALDGHRPYHIYPTVRQESNDLPIWGAYDVIVVGGGSAGAPAAIGAARKGAKVLVIEALGILGGVGTNGIGHFYQGYTHGFAMEYPVAWWKSVHKAEWLFDEIAKHSGEIWFNTLACGTVKNGNRVCGVVVATPMGRGAVTGTVIIDATGDGDISYWAGAEVMHLNNGDLAIQEASYMGDDAAPAGMRNEWGSIFFDPADIESMTDFYYLSRKYGAHKDRFDFYGLIGNRETRLVVGDYVVTALDQKIGRTYHDMINIASADFDMHGYPDGPTCMAGLFPNGINYVPYRALLPRGLRGILVIGRCKSMIHDAMPITRMQADLTNEGYAAGYIAAKCVADGVDLRAVDIGAVQDHLAVIGNMTATHRATVCIEMAEVNDSELQSAAENPINENLEKILRAPARALPYLHASFAQTPTKDKAQALCLIGDAAGVEYLANWFDGESLGTGVSYLDLIPFPPIPAINATIWALGQSRDVRAVPALAQKLDDVAFLNRGSTDFTHVRSLVLALGKIGDPSGTPALKRFLERSNINGNVMGPMDWQASSKYELVESIVELLGAAALYKCGDIGNIARDRLIDYRDNDWRGVCVRFAGFILSGDSTVSPVKTQYDRPKTPEAAVAVYPNPFNPTITISIATHKHIPNNSFLVAVYTLSGRRVQVLDVQRLPIRSNGARNMVAYWNGEGMASGMYFIKIKVGLRTYTKRVILVR